MLPELFLDRMRTMLGDEYPAFLASYDSPKYQSLRVNLLKGSGEALKAKMDCLIKNVPWATEGYYYKEDSRPGKYPLHEAGAYYIQEASAMAPAAYLGVQPGEKVLDLCAAPGGKSTQIAAAMQGQGLLICNEIHSQRARILSENIERMGIRNAIVINHEPSCLAERFRGYFDKIVVDAPCSGEGMFRKNEEAVLQWSPANVEMCGKRQDEILDYAAMMLRPGGRMIYSTCTFAPTENEGTVSRFLSKHSEFRTEPLKKYSGMEAGKPEFAEAQTDGIENTIRLWPHRLEGEGHFLAAFQKEGTWEGDTVSPLGVEKGICLKECREWQEFQEQYLRTAFSGIYLKFGEQLYLAPDGTPALKGLKVLRSGLHLGTIKKNRFEPAHALALALKPEEVKNVHTLSVSEAAGYLSGQTFPAEGEKGWYLITVEGYSLGWGKLAGGVMKNHYPKGLRK